THLHRKARIAGPKFAVAIAADNAGTRPCSDIADLDGHDATPGSLMADRCCAVMFRLGFEPGKQRQETLLVAVEHYHLRHRRLACRQRAGLVESECVDIGKGLKRGPAL